MKSRWLSNLVLLILVAGLGAYFLLRPAPVERAQKKHEISALKLASFNKIRVEFPSKAPLVFEKINNYWRMMQPQPARADQMLVQRLLSIVAATSTEKFPATDLARFGLDSPRLKLKLDNEEFLFGNFNPVSSEQYMLYKNAVYLLPYTYAEVASVQPVEFIDKNPLAQSEKIAGFDFSHLEQWQESLLQVDLVKGKWISSANAKLSQNDMNEWFEGNWKNVSVISVEPYTPNHRIVSPSFEVKLADGRKVHFDKLQESPEVILGRPDEGLSYHLPADAGFALLNPPVSIAK
ncbi:MAG: DUF4340 domain-containing protein [Methylophilaceae bacterium]|nr:DUF4340 domain-containing protein [Methylophilaceae bacterium]